MEGKPTTRSPVPINKILILGLVLSANNISIYAILAFLPFLVEFYFPGIDVRDIGNKAGLVGSVFSLGAIAGNFLWCYVADRYGRRVALISGLVGTCIAAVVFGLAPTFTVVIITRFVWGILNGTVAVSKVCLAEILDDSNQMRGTSYYGVVGGFGRTVGPLLGGYLIQPATKFPGTFSATGLFGRFPFALPCFVLSGYCLLLIVLAYFQLPETLQVNDSLHEVSYSRVDDEVESDAPSVGDDNEEAHTKKKVFFSNVVSVRNIGSTLPAFGSLKYPSSPQRSSEGSYSEAILRLLGQRDILLIIAIYGLFSLMQVVLAELLPIWAVTKVSDGGFDFTSEDVGFLYMLSGPAIILSMLLVYPRLSEAKGALSTVRMSLFAFTAIAFLFPSAKYLPGASDSAVCYIYVILLSVGMNVAGQWALVTIFVLINNSALPSDLAVVNAIGQTCSSMGRFVGPYAGAELFVWSERNGYGWPFNYAFSWYILGFVSFLTLQLCRQLPSSMEKKKVVSHPSSAGGDDLFVDQEEPLLYEDSHIIGAR